MHSCTSRASRSCAHSGRCLLQKPSSSVVPPNVRSVCFTQQPSRWTIFTDVHASSAQDSATILAIFFMAPPSSCLERWGRRRAGAPSVGDRTDSARIAELLDQVREAERALRMVAQRLDGGADPREGLGAERALDLLQVPLPRLLLARPAAPQGIPEVVQMREPLRARDRRPLARVEPHAGAG